MRKPIVYQDRLGTKHRKLLREKRVFGQVAATLTGTVTGWLTNPLDLVKTRLMAAAGAEGGVIACFRAAHAQGGLFKGAGARATWLLVAFPIYFALYDATLAWLAGRRRRRRRDDKND